MKPSRTPLEAILRLEEAQAERHREWLQQVAPIQRASCPRHGWHVPGPGSQHDLSALCPACRRERYEAEREAAAPETVTLDVQLPPYAQRAWDESLRLRERAGLVPAGSVAEYEMLKVIDEERETEMASLRETPADRRRAHGAYWADRLRTRRSQRYVPHPARAGR